MSAPCKVVHVRSGAPYDLYIVGRSSGRDGLKRSEWHNPYPLPKNSTDEQRAECLARFETYLVEQRPDLLERVGELRGKTLACWCPPKDGAPLTLEDLEICHDQVLLRLPAAQTF